MTEKGSDYSVIQSDHAGFHVTVSSGDQAIVEVFDSPPNQQFIDEQIQRLEAELLGVLDSPLLTSGSM